MRIVRRLSIFLGGLALSLIGLFVIEWPIMYSVHPGNIENISSAWYSTTGFDVTFGSVALLVGLLIIVLGFREILITGNLH